MSDKMKNVIGAMINDLAKQGITVTDAAVLQIDKKDNTPEGMSNVDKAVKNLMEKLNGTKPQQATQTATSQAAKQEVDEECFCDACFNFETFEEKLRQFGGKFDYASVILNGKQFDIKYHVCERGESVMISEEPPKQVNPSWTAEQIQGELNIAVQNKQFDKAQILLNALTNLKNKS